MCAVCGCGQGEVGSESHEHVHEHASTHHLHHEHPAPGKSGEFSRLVQVERAILSKNDGYAAQNRHFFEQQGIFALNLVSSPGAGKTSLLEATIQALKPEIAISVIEGDQQTHHDAERIRATGVAALQINTGKACHLDAHGIGHALMELNPQSNSLLFIENVGNLVCPASFDLGEAHKVAILSVTEGDDKPVKYPDMFHAADLMVINKIDLLPYVDFDMEKCIGYARQVNPDIGLLALSATRGDQLQLWLDWLKEGSEKRRMPHNGNSKIGTHQ